MGAFDAADELLIKLQTARAACTHAFILGKKKWVGLLDMIIGWFFVHGLSMDIHGYPWISMDIHG